MLVTLSLYILKELCKFFCIALLIYSFIFLGISCGQLLQDDITIKTVVSIVPYIFPMVSRLILPLSVITAILSIYGKLAADNEYVAAMASGINPLKIGLPGLLMAVIASFVTVYLNADILTSSITNIEQRVLANRAEILNRKLNKPGSFAFSIPRANSIAITRLPENWSQSGRIAIDFTIFNVPDTEKNPEEFWDTRYPYPQSRILAKDHKIQVNENKMEDLTIIADFWNVIETAKISNKTNSIFTSSHAQKRFHHPKENFHMSAFADKPQYMGFDLLKIKKKYYNDAALQMQSFIDIKIPVLLKKYAAILDKNNHTGKNKKIVSTLLSGKSVTNKTLFEEVNKLGNNILSSKESAAKKAVIKKELRKTHIWYYDNRYASKQVTRITAETNAKLIMSFACISFALIGIPLALLGKKRSTMLGFVIGFGFAISFYLVMTMLQGAVVDGFLPLYTLWFPNVLIILAGLYMWRMMICNLN